jgi:hypothetical protein
VRPRGGDERSIAITRALKAAQYFTAANTEKNFYHSILLGACRIHLTGKYPNKFHTQDLLAELHELGIPNWVQPSHLKECLSSYNDEISPKQVNIKGHNRNGYEWRHILPAFQEYVSENEMAEMKAELGLEEIEETPW